MADRLVVGIFSESDPKALEAALAPHGIDLHAIKVLTKAAPAQQYDDSMINFIHVSQKMEVNDFSDDMTHGMGIMSDSGGTGVPGIGGGPSVSALSHRATTTNYLVGSGIPMDQVDNYNDAIEAGRIVITRPVAETDAAAVEAKFKAAGLRNVRIF
ncbi:MAG: hypothetical protein ACYDA5_04775 [Vulcanimicrobiaceae bacterium]